MKSDFPTHDKFVTVAKRERKDRKQQGSKKRLPDEEH